MMLPLLSCHESADDKGSGEDGRSRAKGSGQARRVRQCGAVRSCGPFGGDIRLRAAVCRCGSHLNHPLRSCHNLHDEGMRIAIGAWIDRLPTARNKSLHENDRAIGEIRFGIGCRAGAVTNCDRDDI